MFRFEMIKIIRSRGIFISLIFIVIISAVVLAEGIDRRNGIGDIAEYNKMVEVYEGKVDKDVVKGFSLEDYYKGKRSGAGEEEMKALSFKREYFLNIWRIESNGLDISGGYYYNTDGWNQLRLYLFGFRGTLIIGLGIILIVFPVFSDESHCKINKIINSTINRDKKDFAKIKSISIFICIYISIFYIVTTIITLKIGGNNFFTDKPLQSIYPGTSLDISLTEAWFMSYVITLITGIGLGGICSYISYRSRNNSLSFTASTFIVITAEILKSNGIIVSPNIARSGEYIFMREYYFHVSIICISIIIFMASNIAIRRSRKRSSVLSF